MELLREILPDRGIAIRTVVDGKPKRYRVEYSPLSGGVATDEWTVFGGTVGYDDSVFETEDAARAFVARVQTVAHDEILEELTTDEELGTS